MFLITKLLPNLLVLKQELGAQRRVKEVTARVQRRKRKWLMLTSVRTTSSLMQMRFNLQCITSVPLQQGLWRQYGWLTGGQRLCAATTRETRIARVQTCYGYLVSCARSARIRNPPLQTTPLYCNKQMPVSCSPGQSQKNISPGCLRGSLSRVNVGRSTPFCPSQVPL